MEKILILIFATAICISAAQVEDSDFEFDLSKFPELSQEIQTKLGRILSLAFISYLSRVEIPHNSDLGVKSLPDVDAVISGLQFMNFEEGGQSLRPVIPGFENDVMELADLHLNFPEDSGISEWITGYMHFCDSSISGLTTITNDLRFNFSSHPRMKLNFVLNTGALRIEGLQDLDFFLHFLPNTAGHDFMSSEDFFFEISGITLDITAEIENIWTKFNVENFKIEEVSFDRLRMNFHNAVYNDGTLISDERWVQVSIAFTQLLNYLLTNTLTVILNIILPPIVHDLMDECRLWNIIIGEFSCVGKAPENEPAGLLDHGPHEMLKSEVLNFPGFSKFGTFSDSDICPITNLTLTPETTTVAPPESTTPAAGAELKASIVISFAFLALLIKF